MMAEYNCKLVNNPPLSHPIGKESLSRVTEAFILGE